MSKKYTASELEKYIRDNLGEDGVLFVKTDKDHYKVPAGTSLWIGISDNNELSTYDKHVGVKNKEANLGVNYEWYWYDNYGVNFTILNENKNNNMSLKERLKRSLLGEPLKTLEEAGIKNIDGTLTEEGKELVLEIVAKHKDVEDELMELTKLINKEEE